MSHQVDQLNTSLGQPSGQSGWARSETMARYLENWERYMASLEHSNGQEGTPYRSDSDDVSADGTSGISRTH